MNLWKLLDQLHRERNRLDRLIRELESGQRSDEHGKQHGHTAPSRRGRRNMPDAERRAVSERMKAWWEQRRQAAGTGLG